MYFLIMPNCVEVGNNTVAIGYHSSFDRMTEGSIAIVYNTGTKLAGQYTISIGYEASL
jgi:hypothetical protein